MVARGLSALGGVLLSVVIARSTGAEGLGAFAVFLSLLSVGAILARHGKDMLLLRAIAWVMDRAAGGTPVALLRHVALRILVPSIVLGGAASGFLASGVLGAVFQGTIVLTPLALILLTMLALVSAYCKGRSRSWLAPLFEIGGVSMLAALLLGGMVLAGAVVSEAAVSTGFIAALVLLFFAAGLMVLRDMPRSMELPALDIEQKAELRHGQMDFTVIALATFLTQAGSFLLAAPFLSESELGLLRAAERVALLVGFPVLAISPVIMPRIVRLSRSGNVDGLRYLISRTTMAIGGIAAIVAVPLMIWPERALELMGAEFGAAAGYLRTMVPAQFAFALSGPLVELLNMSGRERVSMGINVASLAVALVLFPWLSLAFGATGFIAAYLALIIMRVALVVSGVFVSGVLAESGAETAK